MILTSSPTQFAWSCLGAEPWPPDAKQAATNDADTHCWLCGGTLDLSGYNRRKAFADTFTNHNAARCPASETVCQACVYMASGETWKRYVAAHPDAGLKAVHPLSWRTYAHLFAPGHHEVPSRARTRAILLDPPEPPYLLNLPESGQKHTLFRSQIAFDRDTFPVQVEEDTLIVDRAQFTACLTAFEALYHAGFSKDQIATGAYFQATVLKVGLGEFRRLDAAFAPYRQTRPELVRLAAYCAQKEG